MRLNENGIILSVFILMLCSVSMGLLFHDMIGEAVALLFVAFALWIVGLTIGSDNE